MRFLHFTRSQKAFVSWCLDALSVTVVVILLYAWMQDLHPTDAASLRLAPSFLEKGFCTSPVVNTHLMCAGFDVLVGVLFLVVAAYKSSSSNLLLPLASYLLAHGYGHYETSQIESLKELKQLDTRQLLTLAAILSIGPLGGMSVVQQRFFPDKAAAHHRLFFYGSVIVADLALVAVYVYGLGQRHNFALLYINLTILFTGALPRAMLVGYTSTADVAKRVDPHPYFWSTMAGRAMINILVVVEPFYCDAFLAHLGGHFLFDVSLAWDAVIKAINEATVTAKHATQQGDKAKVKFV